MLNKKIEIAADGNISTLTTYILDNYSEIDIDRKRPMVVICPGGGYSFVSEREAEPVAVRFNAMGYHACILHYSVYPAKFPTALVQLAKSVAYVREHAIEWNVKSDKIIVAGFSAGGHLAACLGTLWNEHFLEELLKVKKDSYRPNGMILSYPVITSGEFAHKDSFVKLLQDKYNDMRDELSLEKRVSENTSPAFLWHTYDDDCVPVENSLLFAQAMKNKNVPFELHIYPRGRHGLSLANEETMGYNDKGTLQYECQNWIDMAGTWISNL